MEYNTVKEFKLGYEAHKKNLDIQYVVRGHERIKWSPIKGMSVKTPYNEQIDAIGYSFPSGHAMGSIILYGFIVYLIMRSELPRAAKGGLSFLLILLASLIALSRVYLSAHYPSDVVAGQAGGLAWLMICIVSLEGLQWKTRNNFKPLKRIRKILGSIYRQFN